jgi:hypothetical protein
LEYETTLVFVSLPFRCFLCGVEIIVIGLNFDSRRSFFTPCLVGADILKSVKLVQQNIFVSLRATTIEGFVPAGNL